MVAAAPPAVADCIAAVEGPQQPDRNGFDALTLAELMTRCHVPGLSLAVIHDFELHWAKGYGIADVVTGAPVATETLFQAGSISKPLAAMALLQAVQDGRFALDDDINTILRSWHLPEGPFTRARRVTPRLLASHTAGLGDGFGFPGYTPGEPLPTVVQILNGEPPSNVGPVRLERPPLEAMQYSGGGTTILQLALTDVLGQPFPQILQEAMFAPLGMTQSTFEQPLSPARDQQAARGHDEQGRAMGPKWHVYPELAAAGCWTTPTDLARFAIEVQRSVHGQSNRVLSRATVQEMLNPVGVGEYAVGFSVERRGQGWYVHHGGRTRGFTAFLIAHKVQGYGLVVMTNIMNGYPFINEIKERVERVYGWDALDKPVPR